MSFFNNLLPRILDREEKALIDTLRESCESPEEHARVATQLRPLIKMVKSCSRATSEGYYQNLPVYMGGGSPREEFLTVLDKLEYFDPSRILMLMNMVFEANELADGDYAEFGVFRGRSAKVIFNFMDKNRKLYLFDTFKGFHRDDVLEERDHLSPEEYDLITNSINFDPEKEYAGYSGGTIVKNTEQRIDLDTLLDTVAEEEDQSNIVCVEGPVSETLPMVSDTRFRFIHIDVDLYGPTKQIIETCWPQMVPGGARAFRDFAKEQGLTPVIMPDIWGSGVLVKSMEAKSD